MPAKKFERITVSALARLKKDAKRARLYDRRFGESVGLSLEKPYLRHCIVSGSDKYTNGTLVVAFDVEDGIVTFARNAEFVSAAHGEEARSHDALDTIYDAIEDQASDHMQDDEADELSEDEDD